MSNPERSFAKRLLIGPIRVAVACAALGVPMLGCTSYTTLHYASLPDVAGRPQARPQTVFVSPFRDLRAKDSDVLGAIRDPVGIPSYTLRTEQPVNELVAKAFEQALRQRGLGVGSRAPRYVLTGDIERLDSSGYMRLTAHAEIQVDLLEADSGHLVYQRRYRAQRGTGFLIGLGVARDEASRMASAVLSDVIDQALDDPRLVAVLRSK
jgi:hypothetical protein